MTKRPRNQDAPIKVGLSASAEAKLNVKTEIPKQSTGRLVDALTDIIRPFSEKRGLRADQIRMQREEVLIEIAKRAKERARIDKTPIKALPNKFLVPFLERASTEELESSLVENWARLLLSASTDYSSRFLLYTDILASLGGEDVRLLKDIIRGARGTHTVGSVDVGYSSTPELFDIDDISDHMASLVDDHDGTVSKSQVEAIIKKFEWPGVYFRYVEFQDQNDRHDDIAKHAKGYPYTEQHSINALEARGLIRRHTVKYRPSTLRAEIWVVTQLGVSFFQACAAKD